MKPLWLITKNEISTRLKQKSFLFVTFGLPLIGFLMMSGFTLIQKQSPDMIGTLVENPAPASTTEGLVDQANLVKTIPDTVPAGAFKQFTTEAAAQEALNVNEISAYYLIDADFIETGQVTYMRTDFNPLAGDEMNDLVKYILEANLLAAKPDVAARFHSLFQVEEIALEQTAPQRDEENPLTFFLPYGVTMLFYFLIFSTASHNLSSMSKERENRVMEVLVTSIKPGHLFGGKFLGLGFLGLLQASIWLGSGFGLLQLSGQQFSLPAEFQLPVEIVLWGILFFVLGYGLYAALLAGLGALVDNVKEASQATLLISSPLFLSLMLIGVLIQEPNGPLAVGLSLFPFTAPMVMMTRLAADAQVPLWQLLLAITLLVGSIGLVIRLVTGIFRAQTLLSGQPFNLGRYFNALRGRA